MQFIFSQVVTASHVMINVKNTNNEPVEGATIYIENGDYIVKEGQTDDYGNFYTEIKGGMITFRATSNGYKDALMTQVITTDSVITLVMEKPLGFFTMLFSIVLVVIVIYVTILYIRKDTGVQKNRKKSG